MREARLAAGLGLQEVAARLHMPLRVVEALEQGRWQFIGAPVFVRGQLRSYARLLGIDLESLLETEVAPVVPVELVSHSHTSRVRRVMESAGRRAVYVVITAAIVVPVWLATRSHFIEQPPATASLDAVPPAVSPEDARPQPATTVAPAVPPRASDRSPYVASLAPPVGRSQQAATASAALKLDFEGDSWMQATGKDGRVIEQGLMRGGDERSFEAGQVQGIVLGNAAVVRVQQGGSIVDLTPYQRANVARFAVSSDGSVAPAQ
nr:helix-turn-helix domain-containing protein [Pseudoxanthomonas broegbernensis]